MCALCIFWMQMVTSCYRMTPHSEPLSMVRYGLSFWYSIPLNSIQDATAFLQVGIISIAIVTPFPIIRQMKVRVRFRSEKLKNRAQGMLVPSYNLCHC